MSLNKCARSCAYADRGGRWHACRRVPRLLKRLLIASLLLTVLVQGAARADSMVVFNEIMYHPATNEAALEWLELHNQNGVDVDLSGWRITDGVEFTFLSGTIIRGGGYLVVALSPADLIAQGVVTGPLTGRLANNGERLELRDLSNRLMDSVNYGTGEDWPAGPDGTGVSLAKRHPNLASWPAQNWSASARTGGTPGAPNFSPTEESVTIITTNRNLVAFDTSWRYYQEGDPGPGWSEPGFDDGAWVAGNALLGFETNSLPLPLRTPLTLGETAYYFRTPFEFTGDPADVSLSLTHVVDDGLVVYFNGVEVLRTGMADGLVSHATLSSRGVTDAIVEGPFTVSPASLVPGINLLAVEVHQTATTSLDIVFGLRLDEQRTVGIVTNATGGEPLTGATTSVVPLGATWRFHDAGVDLGSAWRDPAYDDVGWDSGSALFFVEEGPLPGPKNTALTPGRDTYYFRGTFPFEGNPEAKRFSVRPIVDDGAVIYLNGIEAGRVNMPPGPVSYSTMASTAVPDAIFSASVSIASSNVVIGQNVLAVEVHQSSATTNAGVRALAAAAYTISWDGSDGDYFSAGTPAVAPAHAALGSLGVEVFTSSNPGLASAINDGLYGATGGWSPAANDPSPYVVLRFNQTLALSSIAWSRDNGDQTEAVCGGTCTDSSLGNFTFQFTLAADPSTVFGNSRNPSNGWTTVATVQKLSAQPGFTPHLRHRFDFSAVSGAPILATGLRFRPPQASSVDEIEINTPSLAAFDAVFSLEFLATDILPPPPNLAFNEISEASEASFQLEIINTGERPVDLAGVRIARGRGGVEFVLPSRVIAPGGIHALTQGQLGFGAVEGDLLSLFAKGGFDFLDAARVQAGPQVRRPDGDGPWMTPVMVSFGTSNIVSVSDEIVINEVMYHYPPSDPSAAVTSDLTVLEVTGPWRYEDSGTDLGTGWRAPEFDDGSWGMGGGVFAFNAAGLPAPVNTVLAGGSTTYYFRARFNFSGETANLSLSLRSIVDDGAVFYLNGAEIHRQSLPQGVITHSTSADVAVGDAGYVEFLDLPATALVQGENVLAVEVHQALSGNQSGGIVLSGGGLALVEEGPFGGAPPMNLARQQGAAPFAIDSLAGFPIHNFAGLTDGVYGNGNSWIGNSGSPGYAGVRLGELSTISSIAFGRDNLGNFSDRTFGVYTLQYTRVATPGTGTAFTGNPDTGWATIGTLNYQGAGGGLFTSPSRRHRFTFTPVDATGIRLLVPATGLGGGTCIDELEVNPPETSGDIAFASELALTTTLVSARPFRTSDEEWVELYHRGAGALDLSHWRLDGAINYLFPTGTVMEAGGYLVIARDAAALLAKWPEVAGVIVGDFTGRMSESDTLILRDAWGNAVNRITIHGIGFTDGGGSSLELIDPRADNTKAEVWRGSDESSQSEWETVSYRMIAGQRYGSSMWNEFRLGLLDVAEVLVDDVSVVRDPDGARQQLIQNGGFETTTGNTHWRWLGSHQESDIITDPDNPANKVLKIAASAPARTSHNHIESAYVGNTRIVDGQEYEVSFRARWLGGTPLLTSSSYHQRLARTTSLKVPPHLGTPGQANSTRIPNAGPTFADLRHAPLIPEFNEPVTISVRADGPDGVAVVTLRYRVNPSSTFTDLPMAHQPDGHWEAAVPGQTAGRVVQFYVVAEDGMGGAGFAPQGGPESRALYQVADTQGTTLAARELRLIQLDADRDFLHQPTNVMSQARVGGTLIYDRSEVFYDVAVRLKGSAAGRIRDGDAFVSYDIRFPADRRFRGVHRTVGIDRSGRAPTARQQHEIYVLHMFQRAALPVHHTDLCYFISPKTVHNGTAILQLGGYNGLFVEEQYGRAGSTFNFDITYEPTVTVGGNFEGIKLPVPHQSHITTDLTDLGNDKEQYRVPFSLRTGERQDDFSGIMGLCKTMGAPQPQFDAEIAQVLNVDEALRVTALTILCGIGDNYFTGGLQHNLRLYTPGEGGPAEFLPWDMDFVSTGSANSSILPTTHNIAKFMNNPATRRLYLSHVYDLLETVFNTTYMTPWLEHYGSVVGQNYTGAASYITSRGNFARSQLPAQVPFAIASNDGQGFEVNTNFTSLTGNGWLDIRSLEVNGIPYAVNWTGETAWAVTLPLAPGVNILAVQGVDHAGNRRADLSDTISITNTAPAGLLSVVINEWMANNVAPGGLADPVDGLFQDWLELFNPNNQAVDLGGYHLTDDFLQPMKWTIPTNTSVAAGGFLLVWADENSSQNSAGNGDLHANFRLNAGGEVLGLFAPDGLSPQHTVVFGPQFQNVSQGLFPDGAVGTIHFMSDWTPRAPNRLGVVAAPQIAAFGIEAGVMTLSFSATPGRTYLVEYKDDLSAPSWTPLGNPRTAAGPVITLSEMLGPVPQRFFQVRLE